MATAPYLKMLKKSDKLPIFTDVDTLDTYCEYLLNYDNKTITFANLSNMYDYIQKFEEDKLKQTEAKWIRYLFIREYLAAKLEKRITSTKLAFDYVRNHVTQKQWDSIKSLVIDNIDHNAMSSDDIKFVNDMVYCQLNTVFMHGYKDGMLKLIEDLNANEFGRDPEDCDNAIEFFQDILNNLSRAKQKSTNSNRFNLSDPDVFNVMMTEAATRAISDSHFLQTGWQGLNKMLAGGFEDSRVYNFIGATGGFKSGLLLNIMKSIKLYNKMRPHKDPTKRPTILFISQENNIWETFLRIYGIFGGLDDIKNHSVNEILKIMKSGGFCLVQDDQDIDIEFRYYGNQDIGVSDINGIVQELATSGRETICVIQDYIERLRPNHVRNVEKRNQLVEVSNNLHDLAVQLDIPIITASQFNREGVAALENAKESGQRDVGKKVGSGNISESYGMLKNFDVNISIVVEYDATENRFWLSFRTLKFRGDDRNTIKYFLQPFVGKDSKIQLMDDLNQDTPAYRISMLEEEVAAATNIMEDVNTVSRRRASSIEDMSFMMDQIEFKASDVGTVISDSLIPVTEEPEIRYDKTEEWEMIPRGEDGFIHLNIFGRKDPMPTGFTISNGRVQAVG